MKTIEITLQTDRDSMDPERLLDDESFEAGRLAYVRAVKHAVQIEYPEAELELRARTLAGGIGGVYANGFENEDTYITRMLGDANSRVALYVRSICRDIWDRGEFWMAAA